MRLFALKQQKNENRHLPRILDGGYNLGSGVQPLACDQTIHPPAPTET